MQSISRSIGEIKNDDMGIYSFYSCNDCSYNFLEFSTNGFGASRR
jgi:hypothetical protein